MSLQHFSHEHPLILIRKKVDPTDGGDEMLCYACHQPILPPSLAAAAASEDDDVYICGEDDNCDEAFYLHKKCAEAPKEIQHPMHDPHPLTLQSEPPYFTKFCRCNVCGRQWEWFTYSCIGCGFNVCIRCAVVGDRSFRHVGHGQHTLTLMQREALFLCDACGTKAEDSSYVCNSCEFWMHKTCASSPTILEAGDIHHHPLLLTYSLPYIHQSFFQYCRICQDIIQPSYWLYYCDECTYFAHIKCLEKRISSGEKDKSEDEAQEENMEEDDLVRFPVDSKESFIHLMTDQLTKWNLENNNIILEKSHKDHPLDLLQELDGSSSTGDHHQQALNDWSHKDHPLELLQELVGSEQVEEIICNGCIQPITPATTHPCYGCIQCNFFLHKFCLQLPPKLPAGAFSRHPQHPLLLSPKNNTFFPVRCAACLFLTNGFYYWCKTCDIRFDIRCSFLPNRIKHQSHNHPLLNNHAPSNFGCNACGYPYKDSELFKCQRMSCNFQIHDRCALLPATMRHRWDPHPIPLIYPPLDHQGLIYCEICEDQINTNYWFYHCRECDHSFHSFCLLPPHNAKIGDCKLVPGLHKHELTFVLKKKEEHHGPFLCSNCSRNLGPFGLFVFECLNCEMLFCAEDCVASHL